MLRLNTYAIGVIEQRFFVHPQDRSLQPPGSEAADGTTAPFFRVDRGGMEAAVCPCNHVLIYFYHSVNDT